MLGALPTGQTWKWPDSSADIAPMNTITMSPTRKNARTVGGMPRLCGISYCEPSRLSSLIQVSAFRRARDAWEDPERDKDDDDASEREQREHYLGDVIVEAFFRPFGDERLERREPDDDGPDECDDAEDDVDVHRLLPHVEQREERDPDDVDEVPVQRACGESEVALLRVDTLLRLDENRDEVDDADKDVEPVESREREERRAVDARRPGRAGVEQVEVLERLTAEESDAEDDGRDHEADELALVAVLEELHRIMHRRAAAEEDDRVDAGHVERGGLDTRRRPCHHRAAQVDVAVDERREYDDVADEEEQEPQQPLVPDFLICRVVDGYRVRRH